MTNPRAGTLEVVEPSTKSPPELPPLELPERDLRADPSRARLAQPARKLWAPILALGALLAKFKFIIVAVANFKVFTVAASMVVSVGAYALLGGWWFGLGLVGLIFIHEIGHVLELRRQGVPASAPLFIPFLGAFVGMKQMPKNAWKEAEVALAGPLLGTLGAVGVWIAGVALDSNFLKAMAFVGFFLNLFNLLPDRPARRRARSRSAAPGLLDRRPRRPGRPCLLPPQPDLADRARARRGGGLEPVAYPQRPGAPGVLPHQTLAAGGRAASRISGLAAFLVLAMHATHVPRDF